ncbi:MAG: MAPEG family protein [Pseudomonadota bacterium]
MTAELAWLTATMVLAASLWIPYVVGVNMHLSAEVDPFQRPHANQGLPDWVLRANRAHINLIEQGVPFAALLLTAHLAAVSTPVTVAAAVAFFWLRLAHAAGMIAGWARMPLRPILFTAGWLCAIAVAVEIFRTA